MVSAAADYWELVTVLAPLATVQLGIDVGEQVVNTVVARTSASSAEIIAAFTAVFFIAKFMSGAFLNFNRPLALVQVHTRADVTFATRLLVATAAIMAGCLLLLAFTPAGVAVTGIRDAHAVRGAFLALAMLPAFDGTVRFCQGLLLRRRLSNWTAGASLADIVGQIASAAIVLGMHTSSANVGATLILAVSPLYAGRCCNIGVLALGLVRNPNYLERPREKSQGAGARPRLSLCSVVHFAWPLVLTDAVQKASRPIVNSYIAHTQGQEALAVMGLVYPVGHMPYGWLNALKAVHPAYIDTPRVREQRIPWFAACAVAFSVSWGLAFTLTGANQLILRHVSGVSQELAASAFTPLLIFACFGIPVGVRATLTGQLTADKDTQALTLSGLIRIPGILATLAALGAVGVRGATLGIAGLFAGFLVQAMGVVFGVAFCRKKRGYDRVLAENAAGVVATDDVHGDKDADGIDLKAAVEMKEFERSPGPSSGGSGDDDETLGDNSRILDPEPGNDDSGGVESGQDELLQDSAVAPEP